MDIKKVFSFFGRLLIPKKDYGYKLVRFQKDEVKRIDNRPYCSDSRPCDSCRFEIEQQTG